MKQTADGVVWISYFRDCSDGTRQYVWVPQLPARDLARQALDRAVGQLSAPVVSLFPTAEFGIVNASTLFGVAPQAAASVTAEVPGMSATVTVRPKFLQLRTGSVVPGDTTVVQCGLWGSSVVASGGCVWTPRWPSVRRVTGTVDHRYHATVSVVWSVSWVGSDGSSGTFDDLVVSSPLLLAVREVQVY